MMSLKQLPPEATEKAAEKVATASKKLIRFNFSWLGALGLIFVIAKVFGIGEVATWSWWLVLLPFYISIAFALAIILFIAGAFAIIGSLYGILYAADKFLTYRRRKARQVALSKKTVWDKLKGE